MEKKKDDVDLGLRNFIKSLAYMGGGALFLANSAPWLTSCTDQGDSIIFIIY